MIKKDGAKKISELSQAFSMPPSPMHLQFAYFEASMVVEYVVNRFGMEALKGVLTDLGNDVPINEAVELAVGYVQDAIRNAPGLGAGFGPLWHGVEEDDD